jgi:hypothetical protein
VSHPQKLEIAANIRKLGLNKILEYMTRINVSLLALLLLLLPRWVAAQNCTASLSTPFGVCLYSTMTISAGNQVPGATYNWSAAGCTIIQNNGPSIKVYFPNMGNQTVTLQQNCPALGGFPTTTTNSIFVHSGTQPNGFGGNVADTRDTVLAGTPVNVGHTWNYAPFANHTDGYALMYATPTAKFGSGPLLSPASTGIHTDSLAQTFPANYSNAKFGLAVVKWNYCSDTVYNFTHVLGAMNGPAANCLGDIVNYNLPVGTVNLWTVTGGNILAGQGTSTVQVQWTTAGTGTVQCNWTHGAWGTQTSSRNITVGAVSAPVITGNATLCSASQAYSVPNVSGHSYRWTVNGVNASTSNTLGLFSGNQATYNLVVYDSIGSCVATAAMTVTNPIFPHPVITAANDICQNALLSLSVPVVPGATYAWSTPGATVISGAGTNAITIRPTATGYNTYSVVVTASGCNRSAQKSVNVLPIYTPSLGPDFSICPGNTATITNTVLPFGGAVFYSGSVGYQSPYTISVAAPGTYWMQISVWYNALSCVSRDTVIVSAAPSVGVSLGPDQQICFSPSTTLTPSFSGSVGPYTYAWSTGATTSSATVGPGTYMVTVTATGYCVDADTIVVSGNSMPSVSLPSNASLCPGGSLLLDAGPGYASYLWSTGATTQSITVTLPGVYSVTATDFAGCQSSTSTTVLNFPAPSTILGLDTTICPDTFAVFSSAPFMTYIWSTGAMGGSIQATTAGTYTITVTDVNGCVWSDDVVLSLNTDCIWPGDANHDGVADNADILAIGYAMPATGPTRSNASTSWYGQVCSDWLLAFPSTLNFKHADADGNGVADFPDTMVVIQNYGLTHNKGTGLSAGPALTFVPLQPSYTVGDVVEIGIQLGDASVPALGVNGIAYAVTVGGIATTPGDVWFSFPSSFMGNVGNDAVAVGFEDVAPSRHDAGQSRVGVSPVSGYGQIAILHIQTDSSMLPLPQNALTFSFSGALLVGDSLQSLPIAAVNGGVTVYAAGANGTQPENHDQIQVYPIPGDAVLHIQRALGLEDLDVEVSDLAGKRCQQARFRGLALDLPVAQLSNGVYLLSFKTTAGIVYHQKVVILHQR